MKFTSQRNRVAALEALLRPGGVRIKITGGLPDDFEAATPPEPPGHELHEQVKAFRRSADASAKAEPAKSRPKPKAAPRAS
jgi:hypothetical protein